MRRLCLVGRCLRNPTVCTQCVCRRTRVDTVCSRKVDEWGQALGAPEVISNVLIDWSLRVRRELSDAVTSAASIHADNVILHIHPAAAQAVTPSLPHTTHPPTINTVHTHKTKIDMLLLRKPTPGLQLMYPTESIILTHCGRVTQICVFSTVKLGTSASSP